MDPTFDVADTFSTWVDSTTSTTKYWKISPQKTIQKAQPKKPFKKTSTIQILKPPQPSQKLNWALKHRAEVDAICWVRSPCARAPHGQRPWISSETTWFPVSAGRGVEGTVEPPGCLVFEMRWFWKVRVVYMYFNLLVRKAEGGLFHFFKRVHFGHGEDFQILTKHSSWRVDTPSLLAYFSPAHLHCRLDTICWNAALSACQKATYILGRIGEEVGWMVGWLDEWMDGFWTHSIAKLEKILQVLDFLQQLLTCFGVFKARLQMMVLNQG